MKNITNYKKVSWVIIIALLFMAAVWQYAASQKVVVRDQKPMRIEMVLDPMVENATEAAKKAEYIYIGSSNKRVKVTKVSYDQAKNQITLSLEDEGAIYSDSSFFAGQRLVLNTKIKVHSAYDALGTVAKIEYLK